MSRGTRLFLAVAIGAILLTAATIGVAGAAVYRAGTITVQVHEVDGNRIDVSLPAGLARVAIALAPSSILRDATSEMEPFLPAAAAGWSKLAEAPDFVLVDARSGDDHLRIEKRGDRLSILFDSPDGDVRVAVPLGTVGAALRRLEAGRR